ncbi:hypothetical protein BJX99DRAFT_267495 [Aspergillus californicus]
MPTKPTTGQRRPPRSKGRPRLQEPAAKLSEDRRSQIRHAQKTYRQRKQATFQQSQNRVAHLERKLTKITELLHAYKVTLQTSLQDAHPNLLVDLDCILSLLAFAPGEVVQESSFVSSSREISETPMPQSTDHIQREDHSSDVVGDQALREPSSTFDTSPETNVICCEAENRFTMQKHMEDSNQPIQAVGRSIQPHVLYSYSFLESSFTRRLKRSSLEHAFRIFSDPRSDPLEVFRVFRLVPCFRERAKMYPFFKKLVTSSRGHSLEISALPFYSIGGAGTHYPAKDQAGDPIYPPKMRVPRGILGISPKTGAPADSNPNGESQSQSYLERYGFGGEWFDCRDVEGFLREKGVDIDGSGVFPTVYNQKTLIDRSSTGSTPQQLSYCALRLESFLAEILRGVAILGRAPGFRRADVEIAFQSALRMRG